MTRRDLFGLCAAPYLARLIPKPPMANLRVIYRIDKIGAPRDFGSGTIAMLHGREAVVTYEQHRRLSKPR